MSSALLIDASVLVTLVLEESASGAAEHFLYEGVEWDPVIAPSILISETAAAITKKVRRKELGPLYAREAYRDLLLTLSIRAVELTPANDLIDDAFELSLKLHHPLHDCLYLALAQSRTATVATRDTILATKARELGLETELIRA